MKPRKPVLCLLAMLATAAVADDSSVYESLAGVEIGRVFLSQQQRRELDQQRKNPASVDSAAGGARSTGEPKKPAAASAGYIIGRDGQSKVWKDGDFVNSNRAAPSSLSFPGDVPVIRETTADDQAGE